jgi:hypothetical protein
MKLTELKIILDALDPNKPITEVAAALNKLREPHWYRTLADYIEWLFTINDKSEVVEQRLKEARRLDADF